MKCFAKRKKSSMTWVKRSNWPENKLELQLTTTHRAERKYLSLVWRNICTTNPAMMGGSSSPHLLTSKQIKTNPFVKVFTLIMRLNKLWDDHLKPWHLCLPPPGQLSVLSAATEYYYWWATFQELENQFQSLWLREGFKNYKKVNGTFH